MLRFLSLFFFLALTSNIYASVESCLKHHCIAVVDAGSTGSRVHIFSYDTDETASPIHINEIWNKKVKPGFATLEPNPGTINTYLNDLFVNAPMQKMPLYFYATAGMRLVPLPKQKKYYEELHHWFAQQSQWLLMEAKTITGNEEALYDWLSVNYHIGAFQSAKNKSVGVMDIGGASVQIVFPVEKNTPSNDNSQIEFDLYGKHFNLFVHSFLGLGQTEMSHQFFNVASCFPNNFPLPDSSAGQGNAAACEQKISSLIKVHDVKNLIQPTLAENPVESWYAMGGISNFADVELFHFENNQLTNQNVLQQSDNQICHQQWDTLTSLLPDDDYLFGYCLASAYYYALMVEGYGIHPEQVVNYIPANQNLDWAKGVVLRHKAQKINLAQTTH